MRGGGAVLPKDTITSGAFEEDDSKSRAGRDTKAAREQVYFNGWCLTLRPTS